MANVSSIMNSYLSDLVVYYLKLHDLHWNVKGPQFVEVHKYTEAQYEDAAEKFDAVAELALMHSEKPVSTMADYVKLSSIKELNQDSYQDSEVIKILYEDMSYLKEEATKIRNEMDAQGLFDIVAVMENHVAGWNKELWFLRSMMA